MEQNKTSNHTLIITGLIVLAALTRLMPHPHNFTAIGAIALFGGASIKNKKLAVLLPLASMFLSDMLLELISGIGFHNTIFFVYTAFVAVTFIGMYISQKNKPKNIVMASVAASLTFFLISNFGVWAASGFQNGIVGLTATYFAGIPFYNQDIFGSFLFNTIMGDLFFNGLLFGSYYFAKQNIPALK
jgi:hypothetical protein